jgi:hypothetical protein
MAGMNFGGFFWKRLLGLTRFKQKISRGLGVPLTKGGRQRKLGSLLYPGRRRDGGKAKAGSSGCLALFLPLAAALARLAAFGAE